MRSSANSGSNTAGTTCNYNRFLLNFNHQTTILFKEFLSQGEMITPSQTYNCKFFTFEQFA
jgi:hypothetical protein